MQDVESLKRTWMIIFTYSLNNPVQLLTTLTFCIPLCNQKNHKVFKRFHNVTAAKLAELKEISHPDHFY